MSVLFGTSAVGCRPCPLLWLLCCKSPSGMTHPSGFSRNGFARRAAAAGGDARLEEGYAASSRAVQSFARSTFFSPLVKSTRSTGLNRPRKLSSCGLSNEDSKVARTVCNAAGHRCFLGFCALYFSWLCSACWLVVRGIFAPRMG